MVLVIDHLFVFDSYLCAFLPIHGERLVLSVCPRARVCVCCMTNWEKKERKTPPHNGERPASIHVVTMANGVDVTAEGAPSINTGESAAVAPELGCVSFSDREIKPKQKNILKKIKNNGHIREYCFILIFCGGHTFTVDLCASTLLEVGRPASAS